MIIHANEGDDEFVGHTVVVRSLHSLHRVHIFSAFATSVDHGVVGFGDALPAAVTVHGIVTSVDAGDFAGRVLAHFLLQLFEITCTVGGQGVTAVHESVNEHSVNSLLFGHLQQGVKMGLIGMHAAVGDKTEQMQAALATAGILHGCDQHRMGEKLAVLNKQLDAGAVHVHNASGADVEVADFAVAHLTVRQTNILAAGVNQRVRIFAQQAVVGRLAGQCNGVGFGFDAVSPAVKDDENEWFGTQKQLLASGS